MTVTALRAVEPAIDEIRDRLPDLSTLDLPSLEDLGRRTDEAVDRLRGRRRRPTWPWMVLGLGLLGLVAAVTYGVIASWSRNQRTETWPEGEGYGDDFEPSTPMTGTIGNDAFGRSGDPSDSPVGLSAAESSLLSYDPAENRGA